MEVLLIILKVLGITLLILLGVLLLILLLILIVPVYYTVDAEYYGTLKAVARARWLWFVLDLKGTYGESRFLYYLKSFGFTISTNDETNKHFYKGLAEEERVEEPVPVRVLEDDFPTDFPSPPVRKEPEIPLTEEEEEPKVRPDRTGIFLKIHNKIQAGMEWITTIPMRIHYKISEILARILDFLENIKENMNRLAEKKDMILGKLKDGTVFLQSEPVKRAWKDIKKYLLRIGKHFRPRKLQGTLRFGLEDPASTGQILGVMGMLMPLYRDHIVIAPDFEQKIFEGQLYAKGRLQAGFFVTLLVQVILNRNLMNTIQEARNIIGGNS